MTERTIPPELQRIKDTSDTEKLVMDRFIKEYMHDQDGVKATLRVGISSTYATTWAKNWLDHPYVQLGIKKAKIEIAQIANDPDRLRQEMISQLINIMRADGLKPTDRLAAIAQLSKLQGFDAPTKSETTTEIKGGVMIAPAMLGVDEWSSLAQSQQAKLHQTLVESL